MNNIEITALILRYFVEVSETGGMPRDFAEDQSDLWDYLKEKAQKKRIPVHQVVSLIHTAIDERLLSGISPGKLNIHGKLAPQKIVVIGVTMKGYRFLEQGLAAV